MTDETEARLMRRAKRAEKKLNEAYTALELMTAERDKLAIEVAEWAEWGADDRGNEAAKSQAIRSLRKSSAELRGWPSSGRRIDPRLIEKQREQGWPLIHPEDYCHRCGERNPLWCAATREDWLAATSAWAAETGREGICCVTCFVDMYREQTGTSPVWMLSRHGEGALAEVERAAAEKAWDEGCRAGKNREHHTNMTEEHAAKVWPNPYREEA